MAFDETRLQLVRSITMDTPGTLPDDTDWVGDLSAPGAGLMVSLTPRSPQGRAHTDHLWLAYEVLDGGAPVARGTMAVTLEVVMEAKVAGSERMVLLDAASQASAAPNTLYKLAIKPGDRVTVRVSSSANVPATADEVRIYMRPA